MAKHLYRIIRPINPNDLTVGIMLDVGRYVALGESFELDDKSHIYTNLCNQFVLEELDDPKDVHKNPVGMYVPHKESLSEEFDLEENEELEN